MLLKSDNKLLEESFQWAVNKAKQFVVTGTKDGDINKGDGNRWYGPDGEIMKKPSKPWAMPKDYAAAFWAGYYDRTAYYIRDFVHQAIGAAILGLTDELYQMFYTFASNASEKTGWYAPWAFNFDHSIYYMDTPNYNSFVREITAQFELVELSYKLYLWTGDKRYVEDEKIALFVDKVMTDFISSQDGIVFKEKNGIPEGRGDIFKGSATYNERGFHAVEAGDSIAAMYSAMVSYSKILEIRGQYASAKQQAQRAEELQRYFNEEWSVVENSDLYCYAIDNRKRKYYKWKKKGKNIYGGESLIFIPLKKLSYCDDRNSRLLDYIFEMETNKRTMTDNIEGFTYLPDMFFANHQSNRAWYFMKYIMSQKDLPHEHKTQGTNGDYPEISFTFISQVITGIMGIGIDEKSGELFAKPDLPSDISYIELSDFKLNNTFFTIRITDNSVNIERV